MPQGPKYEIVTPLGSGPQATVFRGRDLRLGIDVAIKQLEPSLSPRTKQRIFSAAARSASATHEHLLAIRDVDESQNWIISDLMQGSLAADLAAGPIVPGIIREALQECLSALEFLHARRGFLHANLKPSNLLLDDQGRVRLSDSHAVVLGPSVELFPPTHDCKYLAPEMLGDGNEEIGPSADLYCLGFLMLELLIGPRFNTLFRGVSGDPREAEGEWFRWHLKASEAAPRTAEHVPGAPHELAIVLDRMVCKSPVQRYRSAGDALSDLLAPPPAAPARPAAPSSAPPSGDSSDAVRPLPPAAQRTPDFVRDLAPRPAGAVVLRLLSGPRAGEVVGLDAHEIRVGDDNGGHLNFAPDQYPAARGRRVRICHEADGWNLHADGTRGVVINYERVEGATPIRSGDIVRMSIDGPDFQFLLESGQQPLAELAAMAFDGAQTAVAVVASAGSAAPQSPDRVGNAAVGATDGGPPPLHSRGFSPPSPPASDRPHYAPPEMPGRAPAAPVRPSSPRPPQGVSPNAPQPPLPPTEVSPPVAGRRGDWSRLFDRKFWQDNRQNIVAIVISLLSLALIAYLWFSG